MTSPPAETVVDVDALPPTQYLILEVLAARYRLGEQHWTFPDRLAPAGRALEDAGLIWTRSGPVPHYFEARFTDAGRAAALSDEYTPPTGPILTDEQARVLVVMAGLVLGDREFFGATFDGREWATAQRAVARLKAAHKLA
jgi:hypothetical protein